MRPRKASGDSNDDSGIMKTCCCCLDVRVGTIVLGFCHLMIHIAGVIVLTQMLTHPELYEESYFETYGRSPRSADNSVALAIAFCSFIITVLLIYGAITRQPSYLLPFFCLQVFDFCVSLLGAVGAVSYLPEIKLILKSNSNFPYGSEVDKMDNRTLLMTVVFVSLIVLLIKAYFITCVWSCYKILVNQMNVDLARTIMYHVDNDPEHQLLLPNYDEAVKDTPKESPPPYSTNRAEP